MAFAKFNPCQPCCKVVSKDIGNYIGCDRELGILPNYFNNHTEFSSYVFANLSIMSQCRFIFAGTRVCNDTAINFSQSIWPNIKDYLENGGRLFIAAHISVCLQDSATFQSFLISIGSSIVLAGDSYGLSNCENTTIINHTIPLTVGNPSLNYGGFGSILSGGDATAVWTREGFPFMIVEKIGEGYLIVSGNPDIIYNCSEYFPQSASYNLTVIRNMVFLNELL